MTATDIRKHLRAYAQEHRNYRNAATQLGVSHAYLGFVISGYRDPGPKILKALGIERIVTPRTIRYQMIKKA